MCVQRKTNASFERSRTVLEVSGGFAELWHVNADSHVSVNQIRPKRYWIIRYWRLFFMTVLIRRARVEDNTVSECICTVAATYGCKILQLYEYDANMYRYDTNCEWPPKEYQLMEHKRQLIIELRYFYISLNSTCFKFKIITRNIMFLWR